MSSGQGTRGSHPPLLLTGLDLDHGTANVALIGLQKDPGNYVACFELNRVFEATANSEWEIEMVNTAQVGTAVGCELELRECRCFGAPGLPIPPL